MKSAIPEEPQQAAKDAVSSAKDSLSEAPKGISNPFQNLFSGELATSDSHAKTCCRQNSLQHRGRPWHMSCIRSTL